MLNSAQTRTLAGVCFVRRHILRVWSVVILLLLKPVTRLLPFKVGIGNYFHDPENISSQFELPQFESMVGIAPRCSPNNSVILFSAFTKITSFVCVAIALLAPHAAEARNGWPAIVTTSYTGSKLAALCAS